MATRRDRQYRGLESGRASLGGTFPAGELVYTTDQKRVWAGDGSTAGGRLVGPPTSIVLRLAAGMTLTGATNILWDTEDRKDPGFTHSTSTNSYEVTLDVAGQYRITSACMIDADGSAKVRGNWQVDTGGGYINVNSVLYYATIHDATVDFGQVTVPEILLDFAAGAKLKHVVQFVAGGATARVVPANGAYATISRVW